MKRTYPHIALFLAALFLITVLPFNALHHHEEDEHLAVLHSHQSDVSHHCELDDHFCQPTDKHCEHPAHLQKTIAKCFTCNFHFASPVELNNFSLTYFFNEIHINFQVPFYQIFNGATILLLNKGPPMEVRS